jgi:TetR/AcrR family fatty acid metabolism transcriptional regulator
MKKRNLTIRQAQAIKTKKKIYSVAMRLINKKGFDNTTIADISKKAGVSIGAFYHYYRSKDDIFFELYKKADDYFKNKVSYQLTEENSLDQIVSFFKFYANYNYQRGLDAIRQLYNTKNKFFIAKGRYMHILLEKIIEKGQEKNEIFLEMTPEHIANYFFISARGIVYDWCLHDGDYDLNEVMIKYMKRLIAIFKNNL